MIFSFKANRVLGGSLYMGSWIDSTLTIPDTYGPQPNH